MGGGTGGRGQMARDRFALAVHSLVLLARMPSPASSAVLAGSVNTHATGLRRLLAALARAGLVEAFEGRDGGYRLTRSATEIGLDEIYLAVSREPLLPLNPAAANPRCPISVAMGPALAEIAAEAEARFQEALARRTLADVANGLDTANR
jgi:Rrf2 family transcriptional repressor of oqxAB